MSFKQIYMDGEYDCGAAVIAMALGLRRASDSYVLIGYDPSTTEPLGVSDYEVHELLRKMGRTYHTTTTLEHLAQGWQTTKDKLKHRMLVPTEQEVRTRLGVQRKGCAIAVVPSLNVQGESHYVFCYRGEAYDPSRKKRYIGGAQSLPVQFVTFIDQDPTN